VEARASERIVTMSSRRLPRRSGSFAIIILALIPPATLGAQSLPVGDGHVTDRPEVGNVYACRAVFRGGGARHDGLWFHGDTWNPTEKPHVAGAVLWPEAALDLSRNGELLEVETNGLPLDEPTGVFPITASDSVYRYDTNPNPIGPQDLDFEIPLQPQDADRPSCLPMGMIGFTVTGVAFYSALDDAGRDAAAHEIQDDCDGHPQANAQYHYHNASPCIPGADTDQVVGWALDGFPILGMRGSDGTELSNQDLDACHGREEDVAVDGRTYDYAYHLTREYPYTLGCFSGKLLPSTLSSIRAGLQPARRRGRGRRWGRAGTEAPELGDPDPSSGQ